VLNILLAKNKVKNLRVLAVEKLVKEGRKEIGPDKLRNPFSGSILIVQRKTTRL
jgi:hypothetical protein